MSKYYIDKELLIRKLNAQDSKAHGIPDYAWKVINELPTYSFPEEPKNGERFSCPNCGFKADFYLPERKDDCMKAVRKDCGIYG